VFVRAELEFELEQQNGRRFEVEVMAPTSAIARPTEFSADTPGFSIIAERRNFKMTVRVVLDRFAGHLRTAVKAGHANNPGVLEATTRALESRGWTSHVRIDDSSLNISASDDRVFAIGPEEMLRSSIQVMTILCQFTLSFYVLTRPLEFRKAVLRATDYGEDQKQVWQYDPSERDRSTLQHRVLENWLIEHLREAGVEPLDPVRGPQFDVGWEAGERLFVCEVKSTRLNETKQIRLGIGQVLHYRLEAAQYSGKEVVAVLLVENPPEEPLFEQLCDATGIRLFWPGETGIPPELTGRYRS
jgi:hypothetical protein